jgi:hypothetical protein
MDLLLTTVLFRLPHLAIYAAGLFLAGSRREKLGSYWLLVAGGCGLLILTWVATTGLLAWQSTAFDRGLAATRIGMVSGILGNLANVLSAGGILLVLAGALRIGPKSFSAPAGPSAGV